ncbi:MAG TPA: SDR family NAD(P)-dependent oxidoreductase [Thermoanaerobaculia bacterium]|nr:SDR family NAD(P)-dependent oxidoreductase [Thermoanaerobaculia bacterium]
MRDFAVATLTPITLAHPGLAVATARAGGIALLDAGLCAPGEVSQAHGHLRQLCELAPRAPLAPAPALIGLRLRSGQIPALSPLLDELAGRDHILIFADGAPSRVDLDGLSASAGRQIWLEVTAVEQAARLDVPDVPVTGLLARGQECGGFVGADPAFILAQKLAAADLQVPFYVQGGIGVHTAAACRVAGAAGVVLDDTLWLMPESPFPARWRQHLQEVDGQETSALGGDLGAPCRVFFRRDLGGARELQRLEEELLRDPGDLEERRLRWRRGAEERLGWGPPQETAWPIGQAVALAGLYRDRYRTTGRLVQAVRDASRDSVTAALEHAPLAPGSPLARSHGTRYPLVQGPMTRVSDTPAFAEAIADAGGLPLLALALMREAPARDMLRDTRNRLGDRPWGVGILGFVPAERREEQLAAIAEVQPPFALIAGGRPDQAAALESRGVATYLHVPVPGLLRRFLDQGARRFVFEGRECGGHIGPLSSFALWEVMVETLLGHTPPKEFDKLHVLFAGGIHDALSAAMVSALAAPLAQRGVRIGAILGTAYLFTEEAVTSGALAESYQREALECADTVELKTGLGHVIRCAPTPFAAEFQSVRQRLIQENAPAETVREVLDELGLGRARIASKGLARAGDGELVPVDAERQRRDGMYMMGRLATLRHSVSSMAELHADVTEKSREVLAAAAADTVLAQREPRTQPARIAIVGIGSLLPGAQDPETFWRNVLRKTEVVTEVPPHRWDWRVIYSTDPKEPDKTLTKWGGFFDEVPLDPLRYGIPPNSMKSLSTSQLLALEVTRWAFSDAGYEAGDFDRENTSVIIGTGANGDLEQHYLIRSALPFIIENPPEDAWKRLPEWTEESFAGVLANVTAGRVANRFDLGGANYTVDAACASSLTVVDLAISELRTGRSNMVVAVGLDFEQTPYFYQGFTRVQAVSPRGEARTFDQDADGIVISEGSVVLLLKRLADAERDGDKIYAVIQSAAGSSDGKGLGMTAPRPTGQRRALRRAYEEAGCSPAAIDMYEAHGTGTPVGDRAELETVVTTLEEAGAAPKSCAIGSVKSLIGHTKAAAGMVGLAKAALALHYRTLPPHAHVDKPLAAINDPESPVYLLREPRPWLAPSGPYEGQPRRAGVSAFGFGGTNFHAVVEEYRGRLEPQAPGEDLWPWELFVLRAAGRDGLVAELRRLADALAGGSKPRLADLAYTLLLRAEERRALPAVLTLVADSAERLRGIAATVAQRLEAGEADPVGPNGHLAWEAAAPAPVAFLFPGQGSQAPDMARETTLYLPELREALELAERVTAGRYDRPLGRIVFPPGAFTPEEEAAQRQRIDDTHAAQPAIGALSAGFLDFAGRLGLTPSMAAGHSFGELTALHAAGVLSREDFLRLAETRGRLMAPAEASEAGAMAAVQLPAGEVLAYLSEEDGVVIANRNAPDQSVISGPAAAVAAVAARLEAAGARVRPVPVSGAFHSPLMAAAEGPLVAAIADCPLAPAALPVYGNATAAPYPQDVEGIRGQLSTHLRSAVDFLGQVRRMYADGARVFVELGPGRVLTTLVGRILGEEPHTAVAFDAGGGLKGLLQSLGKLAAAGVEVDLQALFAGRQVRRLDFEEIAKPVALPASVWMVDGGRVRRPNEKAGTMGRLPLLDAETIERSRREAEEKRRNEIAAAAATTAMTASAAIPAPQSGTVALEAYRTYQETMRQFLSLQENVMARVLGGQPAAALPAFQPAPAVQPLPAFVPPPALPAVPALPALPAVGAAGGTGNGNGHHPEVPTAAEPAPAAPAPATTVDRDRLTATVVGLVSERTGYPAEMLDLQQDIEADLGIDSIKRIEILDAFKRNLPDALRAATDGHMEKLVREKSLSGWVDTVMSLAAESAEGLPADQPGNGNGNGNGHKPHAPELRVEEPCPRYVIRARFEELDDRDAIRPEGLFLITEDALGVAPRVAESLRQRGVPVGLIERAVLADPAEIEQTVLGLMDRHGPVQGLVHLAPLAPADPESGASDLDNWRRRTQMEVKSLFDLLRLAGPGLDGRAAAGEPCVLGATLLGGAWGRSEISGPGSPASGGIYGVLKTLTTEHPGVHARAVDFDGGMEAERMADIVLRELLSRGDDFEVGYPEGRRTVFTPHVEPLAPPSPGADVTDLLPQAGWVVLVTGGARGITAELAQRLAVPGVRMVVVGRSSLPDEEEPGLAGLSEAASIRKQLLERARAAGETVTPAAVEERVRAVLRRQEMRRNFAILRERGVEVEYVGADASGPDGLGRVIEEIYARHGRLDAVLHGAGIIEDRLLRDKTRESFDRVFDTKADSTFLLSRVLRPESLRWVVLMSSISGRIGNRGQIDYAAANEVMNRLAWEMSRRLPQTRVLAINWGPWSGAGMATDGVIRELESRGIRPIGLDEGWRFLRNELAGPRGVVEVIAGSGA